MEQLKKYKHIFFDLDHTLWDYEKNSAEALNELILKYKLLELGVPDNNHFLETFDWVNRGLWDDFNKNRISRDAIRSQRFLKILDHYAIKDSILSENLSDEYLMLCPTKPYVLPYTFEVLEYLKPKYQLHILTNGFNDVQYIKLENAKLNTFFDTVVTSDSAGYKKPMASIFKYAIDKADARMNESVMIGDNLQTDILGARNFGMDQIYFNPDKKVHEASVTHEIGCLSDLKLIL
ncbi:YjjG family noncanonical pyrimidine nucleotidase [Marivirga atlantica]|jgi:putative hydrolase of the HAD superfamily|uniref:YjjG family noncanonical pyrimidine nucleotidase n=1 Tax=Marivirga atlantica TaxID=1548457 RepID=A0A937A901_9BACT|nr:YjjG family noncanonical pyrimidine nucleotidase [Marivirga atlantica]MBL0764546.1 YjjG family noncanonical pyrimidine nucleotidase [Marivirga atlantica]